MHLQLTQPLSQPKGHYDSGHCITWKCGTTLKLHYRGQRASGLQMHRACQRWHSPKQCYHAVQCSWLWVYWEQSKAYYPSFTHKPEWELIFDQCSKIDIMRVFIILWLLKANAKWPAFVSFAIKHHYGELLMSLSGRKGSVTSGGFLLWKHCFA